MRDFRAELAGFQCWDDEVQRVMDEEGEPLVDCILQNREELIGLCEFIEARNIRSYLEIGAWTGRLVSTLHQLFGFDKVAVCDQGWAERLGLRITLPVGTEFFRGESESVEYVAWRETLGHFDLVFIDANHAYHAVKRDFRINRALPHRFIALHDITGNTRHTTGVKKAWAEIADGHKLEIVRPHVEAGLNHSLMGIGIWSATEPL